MKSIIKKAFLTFGIDHLIRLANRQPRVIFWHGIDHRDDPNVEQEVFDLEVFESQIKYLVKFFEVISVEVFEQRFKEKCFSGKEVVLTFDDGYANNLSVVAPILNKYELPFTVFISTEHIDTGCFFPTSINRIITRGAGLKRIRIPSQNLSLPLVTNDEINFASNAIAYLLKSLSVDQVRLITDELIHNVNPSEWEHLKEKFKSVRPMTWEEVIALSSKGATIGSHCKWHICCHSNQDEKDIKHQIEESKVIIENKLNIQCKYFAYPNGDYTDFSNNCVNKFYSLGFSTCRRLSASKINNNAIIPRIAAVGNMDTFRLLFNYYPR